MNLKLIMGCLISHIWVLNEFRQRGLIESGYKDPRSKPKPFKVHLSFNFIILRLVSFVLK